MENAVVTDTLSLVRLRPDREALARWVAARRLQPLGADLGYAWHALLKAALGALAPQPFVDRLPVQADELLGYIRVAPTALRSALAVRTVDASAAAALGMASLHANDLPSTWQSGRCLSFEVRARPIARSRRHARSGGVDEIDVAPYRAFRDPEVSREQAYCDWLSTQLQRDGAATLLEARLHAFRRTTVMRRRKEGDQRKAILVEGPEAWLRGLLRIDHGDAFSQLMARGIGRHRAFGFGCLLVAPQGVLE